MVPVAGSRGGEETGQNSIAFAEAGEEDRLPQSSAVLQGSLRQVHAELRALSALRALQPLRRLCQPCRASVANRSSLCFVAPYNACNIQRGLKKVALQEAAEQWCSVCSRQGRNTWVPSSNLLRSAATGHRIRAAPAVPLCSGAATLPAQPGASLALEGPRAGGCCGHRCGAAEPSESRVGHSWHCINPLESLAYRKWQLNSDRHGKSFKVHQRLLAGGSEKLLFALEKQSEITLKQPIWE